MVLVRQTTDRTTFLGLEDAEPNLGLDPSADNSVITTQTDGTRGISDTPTVTGINATGIVTVHYRYYHNSQRRDC